MDGDHIFHSFDLIDIFQQLLDRENLFLLTFFSYFCEHKIFF